MKYKLMEDIATTEQTFNKDELARMCRHPVVSEVEYIISLKHELELYVKDEHTTTASKCDYVDSHFAQMRTTWNKLGPARILARRMFSLHEYLFDILDKSLEVEAAKDNMRQGKELRKDETCKQGCC